MPKARLTKASVESLEVTQGREREIYFDSTKGSPTGFALQVARKKRSYYLYFRDPGFQGPREKAPKVSFLLGHTDTLSLEDAKDRAHEARKLIAAGKDPRRERERQEQAQRAEDRALAEAHTVSKLFEDWLAEEGHNKKEKTMREYRRILATYIKGSDFGSMKARDVEPPDVQRYFNDLAESRGDAMANNVYKPTRAAFGWARKMRYVRDNPADDMKPRADHKLTTEERTLSDAELYKVLVGVDALNEDGTRKLDIVLAVYVKLMLLCGTRRTETALAQWDHLVEGGSGTIESWKIPHVNRKGEAARVRGIVLPLSPQAQTAFGDLAEVTGSQSTKPSPWIFAGERRKANISTNFGRIGNLVQEATGVQFGFHDLRATCATNVGRLVPGPHIPSLIMGHKALPGQAPITTKYDHADRIPEVREALDRWGLFVECFLKAGGQRREALAMLKQAEREMAIWRAQGDKWQAEREAAEQARTERELLGETDE